MVPTVKKFFMKEFNLVTWLSQLRDHFGKFFERILIANYHTINQRIAKKINSLRYNKITFSAK